MVLETTANINVDIKFSNKTNMYVNTIKNKNYSIITWEEPSVIINNNEFSWNNPPEDFKFIDNKSDNGIYYFNLNFHIIKYEIHYKNEEIFYKLLKIKVEDKEEPNFIRPYSKLINYNKDDIIFIPLLNAKDNVELKQISFQLKKDNEYVSFNGKKKHSYNEIDNDKSIVDYYELKNLEPGNYNLIYTAIDTSNNIASTIIELTIFDPIKINLLNEPKLNDNIEIEILKGTLPAKVSLYLEDNIIETKIIKNRVNFNINKFGRYKIIADNGKTDEIKFSINNELSLRTIKYKNEKLLLDIIGSGEYYILILEDKSVIGEFNFNTPSIEIDFNKIGIFEIVIEDILTDKSLNKKIEIINTLGDCSDPNALNYNNKFIDGADCLYFSSGDDLIIKNETSFNVNSESIEIVNDGIYYLWKQISNFGVKVYFDDRNKFNPKITIPESLVNTEVKLSVLLLNQNDGTTKIMKDIKTIFINYDSTKLKSISENEINVNPNTDVNLNGLNSLNPENKKLTYKWEYINGPKINYSESNNEITTISLPNTYSNEELNFSLTINDGEFNSISGLKLNLVSNVNTPIIDLDYIQNVKANQNVILDASYSNSRNNETLDFEWEQIKGSIVELSSTNSPIVTFFANDKLVQTELVFKLTLYNQIQYSTKFITINVEIPGCTNADAKNYNTLANIEDGSCLIYGCIDSNATNYSKNASINDDSCLYESNSIELLSKKSKIKLEDNDFMKNGSIIIKNNNQIGKFEVEVRNLREGYESNSIMIETKAISSNSEFHPEAEINLTLDFEPDIVSRIDELDITEVLTFTNSSSLDLGEWKKEKNEDGTWNLTISTKLSKININSGCSSSEFEAGLCHDPHLLTLEGNRMNLPELDKIYNILSFKNLSINMKTQIIGEGCYAKYFQVIYDNENFILDIDQLQLVNNESNIKLKYNLLDTCEKELYKFKFKILSISTVEYSTKDGKFSFIFNSETRGFLIKSRENLTQNNSNGLIMSDNLEDCIIENFQE